MAPLSVHTEHENPRALGVIDLYFFVAAYINRQVSVLDRSVEGLPIYLHHQMKAFPQLQRHGMPGDINHQSYRDNSNTGLERGSYVIIQHIHSWRSELKDDIAIFNEPVLPTNAPKVRVDTNTEGLNTTLKQLPEERKSPC